MAALLSVSCPSHRGVIPGAVPLRRRIFPPRGAVPPG
jgi:hypothetical protein